MSDNAIMESLEQQLCSMYEEREALADRFGVASAEEIAVDLIESLEAQLRDFYDRFGAGAKDSDDAESRRSCSVAHPGAELGVLDPMYSRKTVSFFIENDQPVLRAEWHRGDCSKETPNDHDADQPPAARRPSSLPAPSSPPSSSASSARLTRQGHADACDFGVVKLDDSGQRHPALQPLPGRPRRRSPVSTAYEGKQLLHARSPRAPTTPSSTAPSRRASPPGALNVCLPLHVHLQDEAHQRQDPHVPRPGVRHQLGLLHTSLTPQPEIIRTGRGAHPAPRPVRGTPASTTLETAPMRRNSILENLRTFATDELAKALEDWPDADAALVRETTDWVSRQRDDLVTLLEQVDDDADAAYSLAIRYIELKSRWIALNTKINYETFRHGKCEPRDAFRGTGVSMLLAHVEDQLEASDIDKITEFLAEPVRRAA
jgi:hypothetical protein